MSTEDLTKGQSTGSAKAQRKGANCLCPTIPNRYRIAAPQPLLNVCIYTYIYMNVYIYTHIHIYIYIRYLLLELVDLVPPELHPSTRLLQGLLGLTKRLLLRLHPTLETDRGGRKRGY